MVYLRGSCGTLADMEKTGMYTKCRNRHFGVAWSVRQVRRPTVRIGDLCRVDKGIFPGFWGGVWYDTKDLPDL